MGNEQDKKILDEIKKKHHFAHGLRGISVFLTSTPHLLIFSLFTLAAIVLGFCLKISEFEWLAMIFAIGFVMVAEAFNTAIEIDIDLTSPEYHPYARNTKDIAAGAVLLASFVSFIIGAIILLPKIFLLFGWCKLLVI